MTAIYVYMSRVFRSKLAEKFSYFVEKCIIVFLEFRIMCSMFKLIYLNILNIREKKGLSEHFFIHSFYNTCRQ